MKMIKRTHVLKFCVGLCLLGLMTAAIFPAIMGNWSEIAYRNNLSQNSMLNLIVPWPQYHTVVRYKVAKGAVYFLSAKSLFINVLQMVEAYTGDINIDEYIPTSELAEIKNECFSCLPIKPDCERIIKGLTCAINNLSKAIAIYGELCDYTCTAQALLCDSTSLYSPQCNTYNDIEYNPEVQTILARFQYESFFNDQTPPLSQELSDSIKPNIIYYLSTCNIYGVYAKLKSDSEQLKSQLELILNYFNYFDRYECKHIQDGNCLGILKCKENEIIKVFWSTEFNFVKTQLFGQYIAEIFLNIKEQYCCPNPTYWDYNNTEVPNCVTSAKNYCSEAR